MSVTTWIEESNNRNRGEQGDEKASDLMDIYGEDFVQAKLEGIYHNQAGFEEIMQLDSDTNCTVVVIISMTNISGKSVHVCQFRTSKVFTSEMDTCHLQKKKIKSD